MFYPVADNSMVIRPGDVLAARCTMHNNLTETVKIGMTGDDEMCNFYIMFYTDTMDRILSDKVCFSPGPPNYYWQYMMSVPKKVYFDASRL